MQGRIEAAERATRRGLAFDPDDAALLRLRAHLLDELGREAEAKAIRRHADRVDPPPPPLPGQPHPLDAPGLVVALLPPPVLGAADRDRVPPRWPSGEVARTLHERLAQRLPQATVVHADPQGVEDARRLLATPADRVLTLRVDRSFFATTRKDGAFGLAWLRWGGTARGAQRPSPTGVARATTDALAAQPVGDPRLEAVARALEEALGTPEVAALLALRPAESAPWPDAALGRAFPGIAERSAEARRRGRALRTRGELEGARDAFAEAVRLLPSDPGARELLDDTEAALSIARQLARAPAGAVELEPQLSELEQARIEAQLRDARSERARLDASLEILADVREAPSQEAIDALSHGADLALPALALRACGDATVRTLYSEDGVRAPRPLARFYFRTDAVPSPGSLCLRADDRDEDGRLDGWTAYRDGLRTDSWDDRSGDGERWDVHIEYDSEGRRPLVITFRGDGTAPVRRQTFVDGRLQQEWRDTTGDGHLDTFDEFDLDADRDGVLAVRAEDRDADGRVDVRSLYLDGRLLRREWLVPPGGRAETDAARGGS